ncbi:MAG: hypothetical protein ACQCN3_12175 [Candidatus Bathyarchaeia archaeon]
MINQPNLKDIQKKAYTSYNKDGLLDILLSAYITSFAFAIILDAFYDYRFGFFMPLLIMTAIVLPFWILAKRKITVPRIGYVSFGYKGSTRIITTLSSIMGSGVMVFIIFLIANRDSALASFIIENGMLLVGIIGLTVSALYGYALGIKRLYLYGLLMFGLFVTGYLLNIFFAFLLVALGATIMVSGFVLLARFVRKYPLKGD